MTELAETELISPLLDGFAMGNPMSSHDGVRCCPAIKENSDEKYIVKIISVPAAQTQMDAMLLAGAYKDMAGAMDYFKGVADDVEKEAEFLQKLSKLEGFFPYDGWQTVPIKRRRLGYEVYLVSPYKHSLAKYIRRNPVTHLEAINLGLDLCSALSVCRQAGCLYVDLKPTNIFLTEKKSYRIGDLGFIPLDTLRYTSLPDKYRSPYSPPELHDAMATLNETADTYAVGMILYQLYNDGSLPFKGKAPDEALPSPVNADYEIAEIIMKAIDPAPAKRWQEPKELGKATFTDLLPDSLYRIQLDISGFHKLVGQTSDIFTTKGSTRIASFSAITGAEDGSVMLNFAVSGADPEEWVVSYSAEGEETQSESFSGHTVTVRGLTVGKLYTFTLEPASAASKETFTGENTLEFTASRLVLAENLTVAASSGSDMTVRWDAPGDVVVESWSVRCYSDNNGYDKQLTVTNTEVYFTDIDPSVAYTIEVTAAGMTQPARTSVTANPINITSMNVDDSALDQIAVTWEYTGTAPSGGWLLMYQIDGSSTPNVVKCTQPSAVISPLIPSAKYQFTIQAADGTSIFGNVKTQTIRNASVYDDHGLSADHITTHLVKTPDTEDWHFESIGTAAYTSEFAVGDKISVVLQGTTNFYVPEDPLDILFVIRDGYGNVIPKYISEATGDWKEIWYAGDYHYGELDVPTAPDAPGDYSLSIYFNGLAITVITFTVTE